MSSSLVRRSGRLASRKAEVTRQLLLFQVQQNWFALFAQAVHRVIIVETLYGLAPQNVMGFALYQNQEIPIIDIQQRIFSETTIHDLEIADHKLIQPCYILIVQNHQGEFVGLPLKSQPVLRRIPESAFSPLSPTYLAEGHVRCVIGLILQQQEQLPIFLLDLNQVLHLQNILVAGS